MLTNLRYFQIAYFAFCFVGFCFQIKEICYIYFRYKTTNRVELGLNDTANVPTIAVCVRYLDIIDRSDADNYGISRSVPRSTHDIYEEMSKLTIKQIFDLTPEPEDTLESSVYRDSSSFRRHSCVGKKCADQFLIKKFFMQELVCYAYTFKTFDHYSITRAAHAMDYFLEVYHIILTDKLGNTEYFFPIVFDTIDDKSSPYPTYSRNFAQKVSHFVYSRQMNKTVLKASNMRIRYRYNQIHLLEAPYDTNCTYNIGWYDCQRQCMIYSMRVYSRVPFSEIVDNPSDFKAVSVADLSDKAFEDTLIKLENSCWDKCRSMPCFHTFTVTLPAPFLDDSFFNRTKMSVYTPEVPVTTVLTTPQVSLVEFVIYILSSFGIWFGMSLASVSPINLKKLFNENFKKAERTPVKRFTGASIIQQNVARR